MSGTVTSPHEVASPTATKGSGRHIFRTWSWLTRPSPSPPQPRGLGQVLPVGACSGMFRIDDVRVEGGDTWGEYLVVGVGAREYPVPLAKPVWVPHLQMLYVAAGGDDMSGTARAVLVGEWFATPPGDLGF